MRERVFVLSRGTKKFRRFTKQEAKEKQIEQIKQYEIARQIMAVANVVIKLQQQQQNEGGIIVKDNDAYWNWSSEPLDDVEYPLDESRKRNRSKYFY